MRARNIAWTASSACARGSGRRRAFLGAQLFSASSSQSMMAVKTLAALIEALQELQKKVQTSGTTRAICTSRFVA